MLPARKRVDRALLCVSGIEQCGSVSAVGFVAALGPRRIGSGLSPVDMKYVFIVINNAGQIVTERQATKPWRMLRSSCVVV